MKDVALRLALKKLIEIMVQRRGLQKFEGQEVLDILNKPLPETEKKNG